MALLTVVKADITKIKVDVIVNAANNSLLGGGGVDGAIHSAAGPELLRECRGLQGCDTGSAKMTAAYDLPCQFVIHTVGPVWKGGKCNESELLKSCYRESLKLVAVKKLASVAFSAISCGVYGYPSTKAVDIAVTETKRFLENSNYPAEVFFVCFNDELFELYNNEVMCGK